MATVEYEIPGTRVVCAGTWPAAHRNAVEERVITLLGYAITVGAVIVSIASQIYHGIAAVTGGRLTTVINSSDRFLRRAGSFLLGRFTPNGEPWSLPNLLAPDVQAPGADRPCEMAATLFLARAAYEDPENIPSLCQGSLVQLPRADVVTAPGCAAPHQLKVYTTHFAEYAGQDTEAFVATYDGHAVVVFRGTDFLNLADWATDFDTRRTDTDGLGSMHVGFKRALGLGAGQDAAQSLYSRLVQRVAEVSSSGVVYVTGHSLGAALAATFSAHYMRDHPEAQVRCYCWAQPRVGDAAHVQVVEDMVAARAGCVFRKFVNNNDVVPRVPPTSMGFAHEAGQPREGGTETYYFTTCNAVLRLPRGYWSEHPPIAMFSLWIKQLYSHFPVSRDYVTRWLARWLAFPLGSVWGLFVNDHFPSDYQAPVDRNTVLVNPHED